MCLEFGIFKANKTVYTLLYICITNANANAKNNQTNKRTNISGHNLQLCVDCLTI